MPIAKTKTIIFIEFSPNDIETVSKKINKNIKLTKVYETDGCHIFETLIMEHGAASIKLKTKLDAKEKFRFYVFSKNIIISPERCTLYNNVTNNTNGHGEDFEESLIENSLSAAISTINNCWNEYFLRIKNTI